jgi:predicted transcriptional regulator of viral defense system
MKTILLTPFESIPYFTIEGFRQAAGMDNPAQARLLLHRWAAAGHILPLKKGVYMTRRFYEQHHAEAAFTPALSAILLPQSYVSLEFILQRHNLLTEVTYPLTAVTPRNTRRIVNQMGTFWYRNLRAHLYHGFSILEYFGIRYAQASLAKALFDYFYFRPLGEAVRHAGFDLAEELRLNLDEVPPEGREEFRRLAEGAASHKMERIYENLRRHVWRS